MARRKTSDVSDIAANRLLLVAEMLDRAVDEVRRAMEDLRRSSPDTSPTPPDPPCPPEEG